MRAFPYGHPPLERGDKCTLQNPIHGRLSTCARSSFAIDLQPHAPSLPGLFVTLEHPVDFADIGEAFVHRWLLEILAETCERREGQQIALGLNAEFGKNSSQAMYDRWGRRDEPLL